MALLRISVNGVMTDMPSPSKMDFDLEDISNANRNTNGYMIKETIAKKDKIELQWSFLSAEDAKTLLRAVDQNSFTAGYVHPMTGDYTEKVFYAGPRKVPMLDYRNGVYRYKDVTVNIIER